MMISDFLKKLWEGWSFVSGVVMLLYLLKLLAAHLS
jgi:hypothetical protein